MHLYRRALAYFAEDKWYVSGLLAAIGLSTLLGLLTPWPVAVLVDSILLEKPTNDWIHRLFLAPLPDDRVMQIVGLGCIALLLRLGQEVLNVARATFNFRIGHGGLRRVRCHLYRKLQILHLGYHRSQSQGDLIYRLTQDTLGFQGVLDVFVSVGVAAATLVTMMGLMLARNSELTWIALAVSPFLIFANLWFGRSLEKRTEAAKETDSRFLSVIQRSMSSLTLAQAYGRENDEYLRFQSTVNHNISAWMSVHWQMMAYWLTVGSIFGVGGAAILAYGGYLVFQTQQGLIGGASAMSPGDLMVFMAYLGMLYDPLCKLTGAHASLKQGAVGVRRVCEVLDRDTVIHDAPGAAVLPLARRTIHLNRVSFAYRHEAPVLRDVTLSVTPGEMVAFVGRSGVGKSTLLGLLPRFHDPVAGTIALDDQDIRQTRVRDVRRHFALVLQESILLPATIAENIAYGRPNAGYREIEEAARLAGVLEFTDALPDGLHSPVSEGGQNLSGGQRQRIAIARALLTRAPVLILDEPTSALDAVHERSITETLKSLRGRRTIILVSHRLSTVVPCDRIFYMEAGRIVETGTHGELMAARGGYHRLALQQSLEPSDDGLPAVNADRVWTVEPVEVT